MTKMYVANLAFKTTADALWAYLRTVKPVKNAVVVNHLARRLVETKGQMPALPLSKPAAK